MNKDDIDKEAKKIFEQWYAKRNQVEQEAKENGIWKDSGFDSNNHLFKDIDDEAKEKLKALKSSSK